MESKYQIEKWIWDQNDFEQMGWHDSQIWAISFDDGIKFDLDYILQWVMPEVEGGSLKFWVSPATLIFRNVSKLKVNIETKFEGGLEISDINREVFDGKTTFIIETHYGTIEIQTEEYKQIFRRPPVLTLQQTLLDIERGPTGVSEISEKDYISTTQAIRYRELSLEFNEIRFKRDRFREEYEDFNFYELGMKERFYKRKEYKERLEANDREVEIASNKINELFVD